MISEAPRRRRLIGVRLLKNECFNQGVSPKGSYFMVLTKAEFENDKEQGVDGKARCEYQPCLVVACLKVENSIEQEHDRQAKNLFVLSRHEVLAGQNKIRTEVARVL